MKFVINRRCRNKHIISFIACVAGVSKTYAKGTKLGGSVKNKEQREFCSPQVCSFAPRVLAHLFDLHLEKEKKRLLHRLSVS